MVDIKNTKIVNENNKQAISLETNISKLAPSLYQSEKLVSSLEFSVTLTFEQNIETFYTLSDNKYNHAII